MDLNKTNKTNERNANIITAMNEFQMHLGDNIGEQITLFTIFEWAKTYGVIVDELKIKEEDETVETF